jgi:glyoxylate/hydroxypyruvate reductase A
VSLHRQDHLYTPQQTRREWKGHPQVNAGERRVGILGLGELGRESARLLCGLGFQVAGWNRSGRSWEGVEVFTGAEGIRALAERSEILVCLLPLTKETTHIIGQPLLSWLPQGACIVNCGRGGHVQEHDLIAALASARIAAAVLDVFDQEPLPKIHPFWTTPGIIVTPHVGAQSNPATGAPIVAKTIRDYLAGRPIPHLVERSLGY